MFANDGPVIIFGVNGFNISSYFGRFGKIDYGFLSFFLLAFLRSMGF